MTAENERFVYVEGVRLPVLIESKGEELRLVIYPNNGGWECAYYGDKVTPDGVSRFGNTHPFLTRRTMKQAAETTLTVLKREGFID